MKKHVMLLTGAALLSSGAYASKARMAALGQDTGRGAYHIEDTRDVFRNASHVLRHKNYVITEWGVAANGTADAVAAPQSEGGFFRESGNFVYGLYLNNSVGVQNAANSSFTGQAGKGGSGFLNQDGGLDLFVGGDMGMEWGARVHYSSQKDEQNTTHERKNGALGVAFGVAMGDLEAFANVDLKDKSEGNTAAAGNTWEADLGMDLGVSYAWNGFTFWGEYRKQGFEQKITTTTTEESATQLTVGAGRVHDLGGGARMFTDLEFVKGEVETKVTNTATTTVKGTALPLTVGFEADANSWLTLRGSVAHDIVIGATENNAKKKLSRTNTTVVNAGATLNFGKLKVDGLIGNDAGGAGGGSATANTTSGTLRLDSLMTRVAVHYWF